MRHAAALCLVCALPLVACGIAPDLITTTFSGACSTAGDAAALAIAAVVLAVAHGKAQRRRQHR